VIDTLGCPVIACTKADFPLCFGPMIAWISPVLTSREIFFSSGCESDVAVRFFILSMIKYNILFDVNQVLLTDSLAFITVQFIILQILLRYFALSA